MKQRGFLGIPIAIIVAGFIIAGAIYLSNTKATRTQQKLPSEGESQALGQQVESGDAQTTYKVSIDDDPILGERRAPVTLIEFSDFQCPFCGRWFSEIEPVLKSNYIDTGKVKFVYRDFAFLGAESNWAGEAAECADEQGKFWEYHHKLFESQNGENKGAFAKENLKKFAQDIGIGTDQFNTCLDSQRYTQEVVADTVAGRAASVTGTPTVFIGKTNDSGEIEGVKIVGVQSPQVFVSVIDQVVDSQ